MNSPVSLDPSLGRGSTLAKDLATSSTFIRLTIVLELLVLAFVGLHLAHLAADSELSPLHAFALDRDRGLPELYEYGLSLTALTALWACFRLSGQAIYAALAVVHGWLLLDNAAKVHEGLGARLERWFDLPSPTGELLVYAAVMGGTALLVALAWRRSQGAHRNLGLLLFAAAGSLALFAVEVDTLHALLGDGAPSPLWDIVEDGGEMAIFAVNAAFALAVLDHLRRVSRGPVSG